MSDNPVVSFLNRTKMPLAILVGITATAALKYKKIYVPEGTEDPSAYKKSVVTFGVVKHTVRLQLSFVWSLVAISIISLLHIFKAKVASKLNIGNEATVFRNIVHFLLSKVAFAPAIKKALRAKYSQVDVSCPHDHFFIQIAGIFELICSLNRSIAHLCQSRRDACPNLLETNVYP